jgi:hypothetical protein
VRAVGKFPARNCAKGAPKGHDGGSLRRRATGLVGALHAQLAGAPAYTTVSGSGQIHFSASSIVLSGCSGDGPASVWESEFGVNRYALDDFCDPLCVLVVGSFGIIHRGRLYPYSAGDESRSGGDSVHSKSERFGSREATIQRIIPVTRTTRESTEALAEFDELKPGTKCEENMYGWVQRLTGIVRQRLWLSLADGPLLMAR